jgi:putative peptidoglycan lipid II flippase
MTVAPRSSTRRAAGVVGLAVIVSRLFGLLREVVFAAMFGAGELLDVYIAAFRIPNLLRDMFAEGALSIAFTTLFTRAWEKEGEAPAWALANLILSTMILLMGALCVVAIAGAPAIVEVTNFGFHDVPGKFDLAVRLTRILFPYILFVSVAAAVMGMLNARFVFGVPASASTVFNIVSVVAGVGLAFAFDPGARAHWRHPVFDERALYGVSLGVLLGGLSQLVMQLPSLFAQGFRFRWTLDFADPRLAELWRLMWPSLIATATVQVNVIVNGMFASEINGGQSWLYCAFRLMQLPIGLFGVSLGTATLPAVARAAAREDWAAFGHTARDSLRLAAFLTLPAAVGLAVLAQPIIGVIYQHGHFSAHDTHETALALQAYAVGLSGYATIIVMRPCFYALNLPRIPMRVSLIGIGLNLVLNFVTMQILHLGHVGLALTMSVVTTINMVQLAWALKGRVALGSVAEWAVFLGRCAAAALVCGALAWGGFHFLRGWNFPKIFALLPAVALGVGGYFGAARVLGLSESGEAWRLIRRRLPFRARAA